MSDGFTSTSPLKLSLFATSLLGTRSSFSLCWGVLCVTVGEAQFGRHLQMITINRLLLSHFLSSSRSEQHCYPVLKEPLWRRMAKAGHDLEEVL